MANLRKNKKIKYWYFAKMPRKARVKRNRWIAAMVILLAVVLNFAYLFYAYRARSLYERKTRLAETNAGAAVYGSEGLMRAVLRLEYPDLAGAISSSIVVPGLIRTKTLQGEFHASAMCTSMVPQGMCAAENYLIISAYCRTKKHNTVLYVLDRSTGKLMKTVPLGGKAHAGGIAYDPERQIVWVSGGSTGAAKAVGYALSDLEQYDEESKTPITALYNFTLATSVENSYMAYSEESLIVGIFKSNGRSQISWYGVTEEGGLDARIYADYDAVHESVSADFTAATSGKVQGALRTSDPENGTEYLLLAKSYGPFDSAIQIHIYEDEKINYRDSDAIRIIRLPQKLEQICEADGNIYCLFESAAFCYRAQPSYKVDRVLLFDKKELLSGRV